MADCKHETLRFLSGGYYVACEQCSARWVAIHNKGGPDTDLDHSRKAEGTRGVRVDAAPDALEALRRADKSLTLLIECVEHDRLHGKWKGQPPTWQEQQAIADRDAVRAAIAALGVRGTRQPVAWIQLDSLQNALAAGGGKVTIYTQDLAPSMVPIYTDGVRETRGPEWLMSKIAEYGAARFCEAKYPDAPGGVAVELFREIEAVIRGVPERLTSPSGKCEGGVDG
jgi:hypothetical protein